jgi:exopolysaccharide production protein ExoZ
MSSIATQRREPIYGLDIVRFLAASVVLFFHLGFLPFAEPTRPLHRELGVPPHLPAWAAETWWGWIGVQVFFVISGLVIAYSADGATPLSFFRGRVSRLAPTMLICASIMALVDLTWAHDPIGKVALAWLFSVTFFPTGGWLSDQIWTLPVEIAFYSVVWLMIARRSAHRLEWLAWALCLISMAYWAACSLGGVNDDYPLITRLLLLPHGAYFALGVLLLVIERGGLSLSRLLLGALCVATAWLQITSATRMQHLGYGFDQQTAWPFLIWLAAVGAIAGSLYWKTKIAAALGEWTGLCRVAGLATYPLYLIQMQVGGPILVEAVRNGLAPGGAVVGAYILSVAAAIVIAVAIEPPLRRHLIAVPPVRPIIAQSYEPQ